MKLTKEMQALAVAQFAAQAADAAAPYRAIANELAVIAGAKAKLGQKVTAAAGNLWEVFKSALAVGLTANHTADNIAVGLTVACEEAGVPGGSSRSYIGTIRNMYADVLRGEEAGGLSMESALLMKIKDARQKYMDADKKALAEALARLHEVTKGWTVAQLDGLTEYAKLENAERKARDEAEKARQQAAA